MPDAAQPPLKGLPFSGVCHGMHERKRKSIRLPGYDYSQYGWYFVTVCTKDRVCILGEIMNGGMVLSEVGKIANQYWCGIPKHFDGVSLEEHVVMPNHIHGIIVINEHPRDLNVRARHCLAPTVRIENPIDRWQNPGKGTIGTIIGSFNLKNA